jgi:DNA-binding beta-propeller fold protein YncE
MLDKPTSGPNGLLLIPDRDELYVGDGDGTVKIIDLQTLTIVDTIQLPLQRRADEMTYDATRKLAVVTGPDDDLAKLIFISVADRTVVGVLPFPDATNGIETPAWNPCDGKVYQSVPETNANPGGEIDVVDTLTMQVTKILPTPKCNSHGIVFGPHQQLLLGCSQDSILTFSVANTLIMDVTTGKIIATIKGNSGADAVAYDPNTNFYYVADFRNLVGGIPTGEPDPLVAIINAHTKKLIQTIKTDNITAQSVAVDPKTNKLIIPLAASGINIFDLTAKPDLDEGDQDNDDSCD